MTACYVWKVLAKPGSGLHPHPWKLAGLRRSARWPRGSHSSPGSMRSPGTTTPHSGFSKSQRSQWIRAGGLEARLGLPSLWGPRSAWPEHAACG